MQNLLVSARRASPWAWVTIPLFFFGCHWTPAQIGKLVSALVQDACPLVGLADGKAGAICQEDTSVVLPLIVPVVGAETAPCVFTPITADGQHGRGVVCASACGDLTQASESDPCPRVDAALARARAK